MLDAGVFIAAAAGNRSTFALMQDAADSAMFVLAAHTFAEFYRGGRKPARESQLVRMWRPEILPIEETVGRLAGELLAIAGGKNAMDALVTAAADRHRVTEIFTTDVETLAALRDVRRAPARHIAIVQAG